MEDNSICYFDTKQVIDFRESVRSVLKKQRNDNGGRIIKNGWHRLDRDLHEVFTVTKSIKIKTGFKIGVYFFVYSGGSQTQIFALPENALCPKPFAENNEVFKDVIPDGAIDLMSVIEGDLSPWSYMEASILYRELSNICNGWHNIHWGVERIVDGIPDENTSSDVRCNIEKKEWRSFYTPTDWRPLILTDELYSYSQFFSYSGLYRETIYRNLDTFKLSKTDDVFGYRKGEYLFDTERSPIAFGDAGVCW